MRLLGDKCRCSVPNCRRRDELHERCRGTASTARAVFPPGRRDELHDTCWCSVHCRHRLNVINDRCRCCVPNCRRRDELHERCRGTASTAAAVYPPGTGSMSSTTGAGTACRFRNSVHRWRRRNVIYKWCWCCAPNWRKRDVSNDRRRCSVT